MSACDICECQISDFGAFIDFGCKSDGLVHKSQLSDSFVANPLEIVKVGQKVMDDFFFLTSRL